jgi:hypothetical protein
VLDKELQIDRWLEDDDPRRPYVDFPAIFAAQLCSRCIVILIIIVVIIFSFSLFFFLGPYALLAASAHA